MMKPRNLDVTEILSLRKKGIEVKEIARTLNCAKSSISYHLKKHGVDKWKIKDDDSKAIAEYYKTHTAKQTAKKFKVSTSAVKEHSNKKFIKSIIPKRERVKKAVINWRQKIKKLAVELMGGKCQVVGCGYSKCIRALHFHHISPNDKDFSIGGMSISWHKIKMEIKKCVLVCSNCHAEIEDEIYEKGYSDIVNEIIGL